MSLRNRLVCLLFQLFNGLPDTAEQLKDNRSGNVGHDAQSEDRGLTQIAGTKNRDSRDEVLETTTGTACGLQLGLVYHWNGDLVTNTVDRQEQKRQKDLFLQLRDRKDDAEFFQHRGKSILLFVL